MGYQVPLKEIRFVLNELAELPAVCTLPGYEDCNVDLVDAVLDEAAKFAENVIAPINAAGDKGNVWNNFEVKTAEGFADAYAQFRDSGWVGLRAPQDYGGQGLPALVAMATEEMWCASSVSFSLAPLLTLKTTRRVERRQHLEVWGDHPETPHSSTP